jgi:sialic acid synthase SpsE
LLGTGEKTPGEGERKMASAARRSIVAAHDLSVGTHLTMADLDFVRPRNGLPPSSVARVVGRTLRVALKAHDLIHEKDLG